MKIYIAEIHDFDALDEHITSSEVKAFLTIEAFHKWLSEENERQQKHGFTLKELDEDSAGASYCMFVQETLHGNKQHSIDGYYCEVIN